MISRKIEINQSNKKNGRIAKVEWMIKKQKMRKEKNNEWKMKPIPNSRREEEKRWTFKWKTRTMAKKTPHWKLQSERKKEEVKERNRISLDGISIKVFDTQNEQAPPQQFEVTNDGVNDSASKEWLIVRRWFVLRSLG